MRKVLCLSLLLFLVAAWVGCGDSSSTPGTTANVLFVRGSAPTSAVAMSRGFEARRFNARLAVPAPGQGARPFVIAPGSQNVVMMKNDGTNQKVLTSQGGTSGTFGAVQLSLDGKMAVGTALDDHGYLQVFIVDMSNLNNLQPTQLTTDLEHHYYPQLSPDNKTVIFVKDNSSSGKVEAYTIKTSGGTETLISTPSIEVNFPSFTPDGKQIVFEEEENDTISVMNLDGTGIKHLTDGTYFDEFPSVSADGKKIFFSRYGKDTEMAGEEIFSMNIDGSGVKQLTNNGAQGDSWDPIVVNDKVLYIFKYGNVYGMNLDGSGQKNLTNNAGYEYFIGYE